MKFNISSLHAKLSIASILLWLFQLTAVAQQNPIEGLRGIMLNSTLQEQERTECPKSGSDYLFPIGETFTSMMQGKTCWTSGFSNSTTRFSSAPFLFAQVHNLPGVPGMLPTVGAIIREGRIVALENMFRRQHYEPVRQALVERYGPFDSETTITYQNRLGAKFFGRRATWNRPDSVLEISELIEGRELSAVQLYSRTFFESRERDNKSVTDAVKRGI